MEPEKKSNGALVGLVIILIILVVGGIYVWQSKVKNEQGALNTQMENLTPSDSDELNNLEQELNSTDTNIDVDINTLE